jgi:integrase
MKAHLTDDFAASTEVPAKGQVEVWDDELRGFVLRVSMGGSKTWQLVYLSKTGKKRRSNLGRVPMKCAVARRAADQLLQQVEGGADPYAAADAAKHADTFAVMAARYLAEYAKPRKRTWEQDELKIRVELLPVLGKLKVRDINRRQVYDLLKAIVDRGTGAWANRTHALLSTMFQFAVNNFLIEVSPMIGMKKLAENVERERVLDAHEVRQLWAALPDQDGEFADSVRLALLTGQRQGEISNMRWSELDLESGWWTIPANRTDGSPGAAKNKKSHRVPLTPSVLAILAKYDVAGRGEHVLPEFANQDGDQDGAYSWLMKKLRLQLAFKEHWTYHDLRRTTSSFMTMSPLSIPRLVVDKITNHAEQGVGRIYDRNSYDEDKRAALTAWDARLMELVAGPAMPRAEVVEMAPARRRRAAAELPSGSAVKMTVNSSDMEC